VREVVTHGETGLLAGFFDVDGLAAEALRVLADPPAHRHLGEAGRALVVERYATARVVPEQLRLFTRVAGSARGR
jgi:glycosyltransferase involved in cell wall biosynthesis